MDVEVIAELLAPLLVVQIESSLGRRPDPRYPVERPVQMTGESRLYHPVPLERIGQTKWTHVNTCGKVTLAKMEGDGDGHVRLDARGAFIVAEIVPYHPLPMPMVGQMLRVKGVSRIDKTHHWPEVHPVEELAIVVTCGISKAGSRSGSTTRRKGKR